MLTLALAKCLALASLLFFAGQPALEAATDEKNLDVLYRRFPDTTHCGQHVSIWNRQLVRKTLLRSLPADALIASEVLLRLRKRDLAGRLRSAKGAQASPGQAPAPTAGAPGSVRERAGLKRGPTAEELGLGADEDMSKLEEEVDQVIEELLQEREDGGGSNPFEAVRVAVAERAGSLSVLTGLAALVISGMAIKQRPAARRRSNQKAWKTLRARAKFLRPVKGRGILKLDEGAANVSPRVVQGLVLGEAATQTPRSYASHTPRVLGEAATATPRSYASHTPRSSYTPRDSPRKMAQSPQAQHFRMDESLSSSTDSDFTSEEEPPRCYAFARRS